MRMLLVGVVLVGGCAAAEPVSCDATSSRSTFYCGGRTYTQAEFHDALAGYPGCNVVTCNTSVHEGRCWDGTSSMPQQPRRVLCVNGVLSPE